MNEINDLYDIIDAMRKKYRMSSRTLAMQAKIPATTLASMMSRRPATIDKEVLIRIALVFDVAWFRLLNLTEDEAALYENELRIPVQMTKEDLGQVYEQVVKPMNCTEYMRKIGMYPSRTRNAFSVMCQKSEQEHEFRNSILFVLDKLNDDGLMEAMRRVLDVANDPKYCKPKKEDDSWQKEKLPTGAEPSSSGKMDDMKPE